MRLSVVFTQIALFALLLTPASARSSGSHSSSRSSSSKSSSHSSHAGTAQKASARSATGGTAKAESHLPKHTSSAKCSSCARDSHGRIQRSSTAKHDFEKSKPCPSTGKTSGACPGYVIDHKQALKRGGADAPSNMQWQTTAAAKAKDRME